MIVQRTIGANIVRVSCAQTYRRAANNVLDQFEKHAGAGYPLAAGAEIRFGWTLLRLAEDPYGLIVTEPDFARWPEEAWALTIDTSLAVLADQVRLLHRLGVDGEDVFFEQSVLVAPGALAQHNVFLRRDDSISAEDSGWLLGSVADPEGLAGAASLERVAVANLVYLRRALLQALTLPRQFIVVFSGNSIEQVFDAGGRALNGGG